MQQVRHVTARDVAAHLGVSTTTVYDCMSSSKAARYSQSTVEKVRAAVQQLGYQYPCQRVQPVTAERRRIRKAPANRIFKSREEETAAMLKLRSEGHGDVDVSRKCGVSLSTVYRRIGTQPAEITSAHIKLAGAVKTAKNRIKRSYQAQQQIAQYNELAAKLNKQLEEAKATAVQLKAIRSSARRAAKITGVQLVAVSNIVQ